MAVDILSVSALHRTVEAKRDQVREQHRLRDSALGAVVADSAIVDSYNSLIDSVDSYITNFGSQSYGFQFDSYHSKYYGSGGQGHGGELYQKYLGIKRLCHYGAITSHVSIANTTTEYNCGQCCQVTVPAGVTRMGVTAIAPGDRQRCPTAVDLARLDRQATSLHTLCKFQKEMCLLSVQVVRRNVDPTVVHPV